MGEFQTIEGEVIAFVAGRRGQFNRCQIATAQGTVLIKFPKEWAMRLCTTIQPGERVQVRGKHKFDDDGTEYIKATVFLHLKESVTAGGSPLPQLQPEPVQPAEPALTRVLVCKSSDCCKRGARQLVQNLEKAVERYGLEERVQIETTGCMKRCKQGPNLVMMPQKVRHTRVNPEQAPELLLRELLPKLE